MKTTLSFLSKRFLTRAFAVVLAVSSLLAAPFGGRTAHADEEPPAGTLVPGKVLDLIGFDDTYTRVVGLRIAGRPEGYFSSLDPAPLRASIQALFDHNWQQLLTEAQGIRVPNALAFAVTFGDESGTPWHPAGLEWLELYEVTVLVGIEQSSVHLSDASWWPDLEDGGIKVAVAATFSVHGKRFTAAIVVDRAIDFKGMVGAKVKGLRKGKSVGPVQETNATPKPTTPEPKIKSENTKRKEEAKKKEEEKKNEKGDLSLTLALLADELTLGDVRDLVELLGGPRMLEGMGDRAMVLEDVTTVIELDLRAIASRENPLKGVSILGSGDLGSSGLDAYVLVSVKKVEDDYKAREEWRVFAGFRLGEFFFKDVAPSLEGTPIGDLWMPSAALTLNFTDDFTVLASDLNAAESAFYDAVRIPYPGPVQANYKLKIRKGLGLTGPTPLNFIPTAARRALGIKDKFEENHATDETSVASTSAQGDAAAATRSTTAPGSAAADTRSTEAPRAIIEGNPGIPFGLDFSGLPRLSDMSLRIELPELAPENAPAWFVSGSLAVEITGRPSISLVGEITADIDGDRLTFSLEGELGRSAAGVEFSLTGGLVAEQPWVAPFGVEWLTLNRLMLTLSVKPTGLGLGFRADVKIGSRTVDVAVFVAMSPTGVPTGFAFEGRTNKLSLDDLATLQVKMAKAAGRSGPRFPLGSLPNVEVRDLYVKFAPTAVPSLDIDAGFALAGQVWVETDRSGTMTKIAEVDVSVGEGGITVYGSIHGLDLGPVRIVDGVIDLQLTLEDQSLSLSGKAMLFGITRSFSIEVTGPGLVADFIAEHGPAVGAKVAAAKETVQKAAAKLRGRLASLRGRLLRS